MPALYRLPLVLCAQPPAPLHSARAVDYPAVPGEELGHLGIAHRPTPPEELVGLLPETGVLLTVGELALDDAARDAVRLWVARGGAWVAIAGCCGLADVLGVEPEPPTHSNWGGGAGSLGEGYLEPRRDSDLCADLPLPLHAFGGIPVRTWSARVHARMLDAHQRETGRAALTENAYGSGVAVLLAADLTATLVRIRQGVGVLRDGLPAPDGSAPLNDGCLKSDDAIALDYLLDRLPVEGIDGLRAFTQPIADLWVEVLVRAVMHCARVRGVALPVLWLHPDELPALGHLSHDSDGNDPAKADALLSVLAELELRSTWCIQPPGYPPEAIERIAAAGHEPAMHFDAIEHETEWSREAFLRQHRTLARAFGRPPVSNKNHYLRWEGDADLWEFCLAAGIDLDQSKGPTKTGVAGFCFGTCHPYRPIARTGEVLDVLELPTPMQDFEVFIPRAFATPLLAGALRAHGVLHLLFHPAHIEKPGVAESLREAVRAAREAGLGFRTAEEIARWERALRGVRWTFDADGPSLTAETALPGASLVLPALPGLAVRIDGRTVEPRPVTRWGIPFVSVPVELPAGRRVSLEARAGTT